MILNWEQEQKLKRLLLEQVEHFIEKTSPQNVLEEVLTFIESLGLKCKYKNRCLSSTKNWARLGISEVDIIYFFGRPSRMDDLLLFKNSEYQKDFHIDVRIPREIVLKALTLDYLGTPASFQNDA